MVNNEKGIVTQAKFRQFGRLNPKSGGSVGDSHADILKQATKP